jgi:glycosyltransferase involved in cell wall biosynthesis
MHERSTLRVHHLVDSLSIGGAELLLAELARVAPGVGIELSIGYLQDPTEHSPGEERIRAAGADPVRVGIPRRLYTSALWRVRRHLARLDPHVVHTHLGASDILGGTAAASLRIPSVSTIHSIQWDWRGRDAAKARLAALVRQRCMARVVAPSESARGHYLETGWVRPEHVVTIHNGIDGSARAGVGMRIREELGLSPDDVVVATLSRLRPEKAHEVAIGAAGLLRDRFTSLRLLVVGAGSERPALERAAEPLGETVRFAGYRPDAMEVLDAIDVLAHPSRADAFPTTLLEAMASSVPIVATAVGGIPEIVEDGVTGTLVEAPPRPDALAEALAPLVESPELRRRLGAAGRERFETRFSAEAWARRLRELYDEIRR